MTRIIDLCAGSGMLAHAAAYALADTDPTILSIDIAPAALAVCAAHGHIAWERDLADITDGEAAGWDADVVCGGTPCQSVSQAGAKQGVEGPSGLVREWLRLVSAAGPRVVVWENVHGATLPRPGWPDGMLSYVRGTLVRCGYRCRWTEMRADQVGLMHRRSRVFLVAVRQGADVPRHAQPSLCKNNSHRGAMTPQAMDGKHPQLILRRPRRLPEQIAAAGGPAPWQAARADAIRIHEGTVRRRIPRITTPGTNRVSPDLYEWLMGWPAGWSDVDGLSPADRIRLAGNGVCPRQAAAGILECLDELDPIPGHWTGEFRDGIIQP